MSPPTPYIPLNPLLAAFLESNLPSNCIPPQDHILLVPVTECLVNARDKETGTPYVDLVILDEFLSSHVLRVPNAAGAGEGISVGSRDSRGKPRQFSTVNGRTVVVKDSWVYSKAGFRNPTQAQLLYDTLYYPNEPGAAPWLIYYISKPLIGYVEPIPVGPQTRDRTEKKPKATPSKSASLTAKYKDVHSFQELLILFPMISRQIQHGMQQVLLELEEALLRTPTSWRPRDEEEGVSSSAASVVTTDSSTSYAGSNSSQSRLLSMSNNDLGGKGVSEEFQLRKVFETALSSATELFQRVDQQQMDLLASQTNLTDGGIDRLIEKYIAEQVHEHILLPRMRAAKEADDRSLAIKIARMRNIDMLQVGIPCVDKRARASMSTRLRRGIAELEKLPAAKSPQAAVDVILKSAQALTMSEKVLIPDTPQDEKASAVTINADILVSMLLLVVIRAKVGALTARLAYMRTFMVFDDVDQGETGYILSTLEAVLFHIMHDNDNLTAASKVNGDLWRAIRQGDLPAMKSILNIPDTTAASVISEDDEPASLDGVMESPEKETDMGESPDSEGIHPDAEDLRGRLTYAASVKKQNRSRSNTSVTSSAQSIHSIVPLSRTMSARSMGIDITSAEVLSKVRNPAGESLLMIAVQSGQAETLNFLLDTDLFPTEFLLDDENDEGTSLLSAAIQAGQGKVAEVLLNRILKLEPERIVNYFRKVDNSGRTVAHYLFNAPEFIIRLAHWLPWTSKDKNGQTPLFALCRSYDHSQYKTMVEHALSAARDYQHDNSPLHLDQHVDVKGNTLLHIATDPELLRNLMDADAEINAVNERGFTPLMLASKYGRIEAVKILYEDPRVDLQIRENRGLTAVELAKDDEVRNAIDDIVLFENPVSPSGHIVGVVRAFFVEDASTRFIVKTGTPRTDQPTITVRTTRRSLSDFQFLARQLISEHPGSWVLDISNLLSPYQLPSKPSRSILRDLQNHLDFFLRSLLSNPTFATHELVWEFFVLPEIQTPATENRSRAKLRARSESLDEMASTSPVQPLALSSPFLDHAKEILTPIRTAYENLARSAQRALYAGEDFATSLALLHSSLSSLPQAPSFFPKTHARSLSLIAKAASVPPSHPYSVMAVQTRLFSKAIDSLLSTLRLPAHLLQPKFPPKVSPNPFSPKMKTPVESPRERARRELEAQKYVETAADEVAGAEAWRVKWGRDRVRMLARGMLVREKMVLEGLRRAGREIGVGVKNTSS